ncbi:MAG: S8 family serine peptidase [Coriobacteriales bacterium]|jgi:hypothetical protein|nr:S8 family serine peptidase [Coriobacteriales bacterium]
MISPKKAASNFRNGIALAVSLALVLSLMPLGLAGSEYAWATDTPSPAEKQANERAALLSAGPYAKGEVIAIVDTAVEQSGVQTLAVDMLAKAETLMSTTVQTYQESVEGVSEAEMKPLEQNAASLAVQTAAETVVIKYIKSENLSTEELLVLLWDDPRVLSVEPNYTYELPPIESSAGLVTLNSLSPADIKPLTDYQWSMANTDAALMSSSKELDFDINPPDWNDAGKENASGTIAVVDSGIDYTHPDLNGIMHADMTDFCDYGGAYGYNTLEGEDPTDPMDDFMHGTHCAGIIASEWNGFGTSGVVSGAQLVAVKTLDAEGRGGSADSLRGYEYLADAVEGGLDLRVISNSWGGPGLNQSFLLAATKLGELGAITVKAAGNASTNIDVYPEDSSILQGNPYVVIVGASAMDGALSYFSNYGRATTNIIAPGSTILSTLPTAMNNYLPEAVSDTSAEKNLVYESFTGSTPLFKTYDNEDAEIGDRDTATYYDNNAGVAAEHGSWQVALSDMENREEATSTRMFKARLFMSGPELEAARYLSLSFLPGTEVAACDVVIFLNAKNKDGSEETISADATIRRNGWGRVLFDFDVFKSQGIEPVYDSDFSALTLEILLTSTNPDQSLLDTDFLYIDAVGLGVDGAAIPYLYASGTSMATPMAAGAAMILSESEGTALAPSAKALLRAATLAACVRPVEGFDVFCTSGGELDLAVAAAGTFTPVMNSVEVTQTPAGNLVTLHGYYFGIGTGTVTIGGLPATTVSWTDTVITVLCPTELASGIHEVRVTSGMGAGVRTGQKSFLLNLATPPAEQGTLLFEKDYAFPFAAGFPEAVSKIAMVGLGGMLYVLPNDDNAAAEGCTTMLWQLNPTLGVWRRCADLPLIADIPSVTTFEGKLAVTALKSQEDVAIGQQVLLLYDPLTNSWESRTLPLDYIVPVLANCNGSLLLVGGRVYDEAGEYTMLDQVSVYNVATNTVTPFTTLKTPGDAITLSVAVHKNTLFVTQYDGTATEMIAWPTGKVTDMSATLPALDSARANSVATAPVAAGILLSGASALVSGTGAAHEALSLLEESLAPVEDHDAYLLNAANFNSSASFAPFAKRVSYSQLYSVASTAHRGALYTAGFSYYESTSWVLRATAVATLNQPGDLCPVPPSPSPSPHPSPHPSVLPQTGDTIATAGLLAMVAVLIASGSASFLIGFTLRRRSFCTSPDSSLRPAW